MYLSTNNLKKYLLVIPLALFTFITFAQVSITHNGTIFLPYSQSFKSDAVNKLPTKTYVQPPYGTTTSNMYSTWVNGASNTQSTIPGWYLGIENYYIQQFSLIGNNGYLTKAAPYVYGPEGDTERAIGVKGDATTQGQGVLYAALRMKNNSGKIIKDFDIGFVIEQWYYGGVVTEVDLEYAIGPNVINASTTSVTWNPLTKVATPINSGIARPLDGNSAANKVARTHNLTNVNLAVGQEIVFRWALKVTTNNTLFNGIALDDVTITPKNIGSESNLDPSDKPQPVQKIYYNKADEKLDDTKNWGTNPDGSGTRPRNFTDPNQTFIIKNFEDEDDKPWGKWYKYREDDFTLEIKSKEGWVVSGAGSKIILGDGVRPVKVAIHKDKFISGTLDLAAHAMLVLNTDKESNKDKKVPNILPTFGTLHPTSTVIYSDSTDMDIANTVYGNLVVLGNEYSKSKITYSQLNLSSSLSIKGKLELDGKKMKLADKSLTIDSNGDVANANTKSYIIADGTGTLNRVVPGLATSEINFPVGTSQGYAPVKIKGSDKPINFKVAVKDGVQNALNHNGTSQEAISGKTWIIEKQQLTDGTPKSTVVLQWEDVNNKMAGYSSPKLYVGRYNTTTSKWELKQADSFKKNTTTGLYEVTFTDNFNAATDAAGLGAVTQTNNSLRVNQAYQALAETPAQAQYAIYGGNAPMPVELISFNAVHSNGASNLTWSTASEQDNSHFEVEHSLDAKQFTTIGEVKGNGNSSTTVNYSFKHLTQTEGTHYYRLKQVDLNGEWSYSNIVAVEADKNITDLFTVSPNPTSGKAILSVSASSEDRMITIISISGKVVKEQMIPAGIQHVPISIEGQPAGAYIVRLQSNDYTITSKLIKY